jgi:hypothetical protein
MIVRVIEIRTTLDQNFDVSGSVFAMGGGCCPMDRRIALVVFSVDFCTGLE